MPSIFLAMVWPLRATSTHVMTIQPMKNNAPRARPSGASCRRSRHSALPSEHLLGDGLAVARDEHARDDDPADEEQRAEGKAEWRERRQLAARRRPGHAE